MTFNGNRKLKRSSTKTPHVVVNTVLVIFYEQLFSLVINKVNFLNQRQYNNSQIIAALRVEKRCFRRRLLLVMTDFFYVNLVLKISAIILDIVVKRYYASSHTAAGTFYLTKTFLVTTKLIIVRVDCSFILIIKIFFTNQFFAKLYQNYNIYTCKIQNICVQQLPKKCFFMPSI